MFGDPFRDDPFFANSGFGRMDSMFKEMRSEMKRMMDGPMMRYVAEVHL